MLLDIIADINTFLSDHSYLRYILDGYFVLIIASLFIFIALKYKKALFLLIIGIVTGIIYYLSNALHLKASKEIYSIFFLSYMIICTILLAPELRRLMEVKKGEDTRKIISKENSSEKTKEAIADAVFTLARGKVGALITIEQQIKLDQYAERAITLNSEVSKELLEQIFIKDSPLHDGGVIIRGNKILCAAAYYNLTQDQSLDKTTGSRHRAGLGISEITDSVTIIVSEETGDVHVAIAGYMKLLSSENELLDYISSHLDGGRNENI